MNHRFSVANTAWTNGTVERMMLEIVKTIRVVASAAMIPPKDWVGIVSVVQGALNAGYRGRLNASSFNLTFGRNLFSVFSALVVPGKDEWHVDSLAPESVLVKMRDLMGAQEKGREEVLGLARKNRARMRGNESKEGLPDFEVENYVLVARVRQPGITPKIVKTWTGPWRVVSKTGQHVYGVEDIVTGRSREVHIERMRPHANASLNVTAELKEVFNNLKSRGEFDMERIEAVDLAADSEEYAVKVKWVGLDEERTTWKSVSAIYADAPNCGS